MKESDDLHIHNFIRKPFIILMNINDVDNLSKITLNSQTSYCYSHKIIKAMECIGMVTITKKGRNIMFALSPEAIKIKNLITEANTMILSLKTKSVKPLLQPEIIKKSSKKKTNKRKVNKK